MRKKTQVNSIHELSYEINRIIEQTDRTAPPQLANAVITQLRAGQEHIDRASQAVDRWLQFGRF